MAMKLNEIQDLIKFVAKSGVHEVEIEQKDFKITIKSPGKKRAAGSTSEQVVVQQARSRGLPTCGSCSGTCASSCRTCPSCQLLQRQRRHQRQMMIASTKRSLLR